ncbi:hypothetical protein [Stagnihabitans tardus]|uniref:Uncharacterized protein n=1 Tax=Stagnihabitans tardus TaxID=2699202 RepID=A0AAE5BX76_9RHOB|nr:hypothetical protein [Stagnihabitans tardus]NBZ90082.1 hypothetical protein [Stagnihabitans tardus]
MSPIERNVQQLMVLQSQINVLFLDLCLNQKFDALMKLNQVYECISNFLIRRIDGERDPFDIDEIIRGRLREICPDDYLDSLYARVDRALSEAPDT